jgi:hypothetical protein
VGDTPSAAVFEKTLRDYLAQVKKMPAVVLDAAVSILGIRQNDGDLVIPFFQKQYRLTHNGVFDPSGRKAGFSISVVLCRYIIMGCHPPVAGGEEWVSYRDFPDAAPFAGAFDVNTQQAIARNFSGRSAALEAAVRRLGGEDPGDRLPYDLAAVIPALPRVPLYLLFNDADDEFPARSRILFKRRAEACLDMECLAILGWLLSDYLLQACGKTSYKNLI